MTSYANGVPSWVDLATPDLAATKEFSVMEPGQ